MHQTQGHYDLACVIQSMVNKEMSYILERFESNTIPVPVIWNLHPYNSAD